MSKIQVNFAWEEGSPENQKDLLERIEEYRHDKRIQYRNDAIKQLLADALDREGYGVAPKPAKPKSKPWVPP